MHRYEYKYLVPFSLADAVREAVTPFTVPDPHWPPGRSDYTIRSIYLDRARFNSFTEKKEGIRDRCKLRIRGYNEGDEDSTVFLEIKRRRGLPVLKARAPVRLGDVPALLATGDISRYVSGSGDISRATADARSFLYYYHRFGMRPTVKVVYEREAYFGRFDRSVRITLDLNLRSEMFPDIGRLFQQDRHRFVYRDHFIVEIKYTGAQMPVWARSLVERMEGKWRALSKYTICLESHRARVHRLDAAVRARPLPGQTRRDDHPSFTASDTR